MTDVVNGVFQGITAACEMPNGTTHHLCAGCLCKCHTTAETQADRIERKLDSMLEVLSTFNALMERIEPELERLGPIVDAIQEHPMVRMIIKRAEKKAGN